MQVLTEPRPPGPAGVVLDSGAAEPTDSRRLSVAELQRALQVARRTPPLDAPPVVPAPEHVLAAATSVVATDAAVSRPAWGSRGVRRPEATRRWVAVVGAHGGAGASTVALALADAAAAAGRLVQLVSCDRPGRCGLLAAASVELGVDPSGRWRTGRRGPRITVDRLLAAPNRHIGADQAGWLPLPPAIDGDPLMIVDAAAGAAHDPRWLASAVAVVAVCRVSVPGVQHLEQLLGPLLDTQLPPGGAIGNRQRRPVLVAALGPGRWPGPVTSATGPLLRTIKAAGHVVPMPLDRRLATVGPTSNALPRAVTSAGDALLRQLPDVGSAEPCNQTISGAGGWRPVPQRIPMPPAQADQPARQSAR